MSLFGKKKNEGVKFPYSLVLSFGIFLLTALFSVCYANPAYNPSTGDTWETNPIWQVSFLTGVYGLLFVLELGFKYAFKDRDNEDYKFAPWAYFGTSIAEFGLILFVMICYFIAYPGVRDGITWTGRIAIAILICVLSIFNILIRYPKYMDFKGMFENIGHELISITVIGALAIIPQLMLLIVLEQFKNRETAKTATVFVLVLCVLILLVPFFATKFLKTREQTHLLSAVCSFAMTVVFLIFLVVFYQHYKQEIDPITYQEVYWAMFVYGFSILVSLGLTAYHGVIVYLIKKR